MGNDRQSGGEEGAKELERGSTQFSSETSDVPEEGEGCCEDFPKTQEDTRSCDAVEIVDFSPDWDDVSGGAKVLICVSPAVVVPDYQLLFVAFGETRVSLEHVQLGVMRCRAPPHRAGFVELYLMYDGQELSLQRKQFEYRQLSRKRSEATEVSWQSLNDHDFKVRLVEHMTSFDNTLDWDIGTPDDDSIEDLIAQFVLRMQRTGQQITGLDEHGFSIVHYCAALDMTKPLKLFEEAEVNLKSAEGLTPLEVASILHKFKAMSTLLAEGADPVFTTAESVDVITRMSASKTSKLSAKELESQVKIIQSNVKTWLMRRHFRDVQRATGTLRRGNSYSAVRTLLLRRHFLEQKKAAKLIQKTVRCWLLEKDCKANYRTGYESDNCRVRP
jgi:hypothetical protein